MQINDLNNIDKLKAIEEWQEDSSIHSLVCLCGLGMFGDIENSKVFLRCPKGHIQKHIPKVVFERYIKTNNLD